MKITAISDIHGDFPVIESTDVLCICGDIVPLAIQRDVYKSIHWFESVFFEWVKNLPCQKVIIIGGNHDFFFYWIGRFKVREIISDCNLENKLIYLENSTYVYNDITFYGCPAVENLYGWAFYTRYGEEYLKIPQCDVLLTHQPPDIGMISTSCYGNWGSILLRDRILNGDIKYHFCGHVHEGDHNPIIVNNTIIQNVSYKNEDYNPAFEPACVEI